MTRMDTMRSSKHRREIEDIIIYHDWDFDGLSGPQSSCDWIGQHGMDDDYGSLLDRKVYMRPTYAQHLDSTRSS